MKIDEKLIERLQQLIQGHNASSRHLNNSAEIILFGNQNCENINQDEFLHRNICRQDNTTVVEKVVILPDNLLTPQKEQNNPKTELAKKLYKKWTSKWSNSPLTQSFFEKLYDVVKILNIKIPDNEWDKENYSSPEEQAMDQVCAIFAGESILDPRTVRHGKIDYYGLFQLAEDGLTEIKNYAKTHPNEPGMSNISNSMTLSKFVTLSGEDQLDYLMAYIGKCKQYSKIGKNEAITPAQLWAMIKWPFKGKDGAKIKEKTNAISQVFSKNKVEIGIA